MLIIEETEFVVYGNYSNSCVQNELIREVKMNDNESTIYPNMGIAAKYVLRIICISLNIYII